MCWQLLLAVHVREAAAGVTSMAAGGGVAGAADDRYCVPGLEAPVPRPLATRLRPWHTVSPTWAAPAPMPRAWASTESAELQRLHALIHAATAEGDDGEDDGGGDGNKDGGACAAVPPRIDTSFDGMSGHLAVVRAATTAVTTPAPAPAAVTDIVDDDIHEFVSPRARAAGGTLC